MLPFGYTAFIHRYRAESRILRVKILTKGGMEPINPGGGWE